MPPHLIRPNRVRLALFAGVFVALLALGIGPARDWRQVRAANVDLRETPLGAVADSKTPRSVPPWPEELARRLFAFDDAAVFDPLCGFRHDSNLALMQFLPEHTPQRFRRVTNSLGLREDDEVLVPRARLRILVSGDSHTDGVCTNPESFSNLLEVALRKRCAAEAAAAELPFEPAWIEVLNAGKGGYSFCNYYGVLARFLELDLAPDVFVVAVYGGNDFEETLLAHYVLHGGERPPGKALYIPQVRSAKRAHAAALAQGLLAAKYFAVQPSQIEVATNSAMEWLERIQALADQHGIEVILAYIPPWFDVAASMPRVPLDMLLAKLELDPAALGAADGIANALLLRSQGAGLEWLDLRAAFAHAGASAYWQSDLHISLVGHELVARALEERLARRAQACMERDGSSAAQPLPPDGIGR